MALALDTLPAVTAAYSMRRLLTSYVANKAINVRRASDSATLDMGFLANGDPDVATLAAFLAATTGSVTTWYDQSGSGFDLAQGTTTKQPAYLASSAAVSNRPVATFLRASSQLLTKATPPSPAQPFTISVIAQRTGSFTLFQEIVGGNTGNNGFFFGNAADTIGIFAGTANQLIAAADASAHVLAAVFNGASSKFAVDGAITTVAATPGAAGPVGLAIGQGGGLNSLTGLVGEMIVFPSAVSDANLGILQTDQTNWWILGISPPFPVVPSSYDPLAQHGGQGQRRWDRIRKITKERPDDEVLADHVASLVAHLLGLPPSQPAPRKAVAAVLASPAAVEALDTGQWELAETRATAAILESKIAGLERQKAILLKRQEDEDDDEEAMELILGHA